MRRGITAVHNPQPRRYRGNASSSKTAGRRKIDAKPRRSAAMTLQQTKLPGSCTSYAALTHHWCRTRRCCARQKPFTSRMIALNWRSSPSNSRSWATRSSSSPILRAAPSVPDWIMEVHTPTGGSISIDLPSRVIDHFILCLPQFLANCLDYRGPRGSVKVTMHALESGVRRARAQAEWIAAHLRMLNPCHEGPHSDLGLV